ncbi:putative ribonuclease H-like domain-containing protein [Tanacetum coccineum]|uniref:Ribonuclease H-like domain-containing protein n=1 Tax=Tanacetum coccineum TaxID=301880 RepID=A0ABQ4ZAW8_9ASTR
MDTGGSPRRQDTMEGAPAQTKSERVLKNPNEPPFSEGNTSRSREGRMEHQFELMVNVPITPYDSPLPGGYTLGSDKGRMKLQELMTMCTKLSKQVLDLEKEKEEILTDKANVMQLLKWKLHENYGVYTLFMNGTPMEINMIVEKKYPLIKELLEKMLNLQLEAEEESTMALMLEETPQQNGVAERKNRILIEAARTMLADSKLPTTLWAKVVNIACYVQNKVLVIKPHNKTSYELFLGRKPALSFMRPFGCPITILNTIDHLVVARNQSNGNAGTKAYDDAGKARVETDSPDAGFKPSGEEEKKDAEDPGNASGNPPEGKDSEVPSTEEPRINQEKDDNVNNTNNINIVSPTVNASIEDYSIDENIIYGCADDPNILDLEEISRFTNA